MSAQDTPDTLDGLAGIAAGFPVDALRKEHPQTRDNTQASYVALFEATDETGVSKGERFAIASFVALLHEDAPSTEHYLLRLERQPDGAALAEALRRQAKLATAEGPYGAYPPGPLSAEDLAGPVFRVDPADRPRLGERLPVALEHVHLLVFHPRDAHAPAIAALRSAGWSTAAIVTLSQIVAFLSFQIRAAHGLRVLAA